MEPVKVMSSWEGGREDGEGRGGGGKGREVGHREQNFKQQFGYGFTLLVIKFATAEFLLMKLNHSDCHPIQEATHSAEQTVGFWDVT